VIFDSGASVNHLPTRDYNTVMKIITEGHTCTKRADLHNATYCQCDPFDVTTFPDFQITIGDVELTMESKYYLVYEEENGCMIAFLEETSAYDFFWLLGDPFLRAHYTIYDKMNRIGFVHNNFPIPAASDGNMAVVVPIMLCALVIVVMGCSILVGSRIRE
jgi:hypothetical protein